MNVAWYSCYTLSVIHILEAPLRQHTLGNALRPIDISSTRGLVDGRHILMSSLVLAFVGLMAAHLGLALSDQPLFCIFLGRYIGTVSYGIANGYLEENSKTFVTSKLA